MVEDPETAEKLKKQAEEDWELLLLQRAKEMAPGELYHTYDYWNLFRKQIFVVHRPLAALKTGVTLTTKLW